LQQFAVFGDAIGHSSFLLRVGMRAAGLKMLSCDRVAFADRLFVLPADFYHFARRLQWDYIALLH
jgi:hypothetical protein